MGLQVLCLVGHSLISVQFVSVLRLVRCNATQCGFNSRFRLYYSGQSPISLHPLFSSIEEMSFSGQAQTKDWYYRSLLIFPAIRGNYYVIERHGYSPYSFAYFGGWWMSRCMDKSMLLLISLCHRLISTVTLSFRDRSKMTSAEKGGGGGVESVKNRKLKVWKLTCKTVKLQKAGEKKSQMKKNYIH